jgi:hypothetical protein
MGTSKPQGDSHKRLADRSFGLLFGGLMVGITALAFFVSGSRWPVLGAIGSALLVLALVAPGLLMPLNRLWDALTRRLVPVTNGLVLGLFFYLVVLPVGLVRHLFDRDPLEQKRLPEAESYWTPVGRQVNAETLKDMF